MLVLRYVGGGFGKVWYNSQEDYKEGVKWGYEILGLKYRGGGDVRFDEEH
jgi:hypothetical protein